MNADSDAKEDDYALVYKCDEKPLEVTDIFSYINFPENVTLSSAVTDYISCNFKDVDNSGKMYECRMYVSPEYVDFDCMLVEGQLRVNYRSNDGLNYILSRIGTSTGSDVIAVNNPVNLTVNLQVDEDGEYSEPYNPIIGNFIRVLNPNISGIYKCLPTNDYGKFQFLKLNGTLSEIEGNTANLTISKIYLDTVYNKSDIKSVVEKFRTETGTAVNYSRYYINTNDELILMIVTGGYSGTYCLDGFTLDNNGNFSKVCVGSDSSGTYGYYSVNLYKLDINNQTYELWKQVPLTQITHTDSYSGKLWVADFEEFEFKSYFGDIGLGNGDLIGCEFYTKFLSEDGSYKIITNTYTDKNNKSYSNIINYYSTLLYRPVATQLDATPEDVANVKFLGANGIETGVVGVNISNKFDDATSKFYCNLQAKYDEMEVVNLTDATRKTYIPNYSNMYFIPTKSTGECLYNFSNITNFTYMFFACSNLRYTPELSNISLTNATNMYGYCSNLKYINKVNTDDTTTMGAMFQQDYNLKQLPLDINFTKCENINGMCSACRTLTYVDFKDTPNLSTAYNTFAECSNLITVNGFNASTLWNGERCFSNCFNLTNFTNSNLNFHGCQMLNFMFYNCKNLTQEFNLDLYNCKYAHGMLGCTNVYNITMQNCNNLTTVYSMFYNCENLNNTSLDNIMGALVNATNINSAQKHLHSSNFGLGFSNDQINICKTLSNYNRLISAGWSDR